MPLLSQFHVRRILSGVVERLGVAALNNGGVYDPSQTSHIVMHVALQCAITIAMVHVVSPRLPDASDLALVAVALVGTLALLVQRRRRRVGA